MRYLGIIAAGICLSFTKPTFYSTTPLADSIELTDGSQWGLPPSAEKIVSSWQEGDELAIYPDRAWFHAYDYSIYNKNNDTKVAAILSEGPFAFHELSNWILHIDHWTGHVQLQDTSTWCVHPKDEILLEEWSLNDHILIGSDTLPFSYYPQVLINVDMNEHVRARQYSR